MAEISDECGITASKESQKSPRRPRSRQSNIGKMATISCELEINGSDESQESPHTAHSKQSDINKMGTISDECGITTSIEAQESPQISDSEQSEVCKLATQTQQDSYLPPELRTHILSFLCFDESRDDSWKIWLNVRPVCRQFKIELEEKLIKTMAKQPQQPVAHDYHCATCRMYVFSPYFGHCESFNHHAKTHRGFEWTNVLSVAPFTLDSVYTTVELPTRETFRNICYELGWSRGGKAFKRRIL